MGIVQTNLGYFATLWPWDGGVKALADATSDAFDISDYGKVSGYLLHSPDRHAFLYDPATDKTTDLETLRRCTKSFGRSVNDWGQVVGDSYDPSYQHAFCYTPGVGMVDLRDDIRGSLQWC